jgi:tyrosyl-tRNA synthetase
LVQRKGLHMNGELATDAQQLLCAEDLLFGKHLVLRRGKKNYFLVSLSQDQPE